MLNKNSSYAAVLIGIVVVVSILIGSGTSFFRALNNFSYDILTSMVLEPVPSDKIVVIEAENSFSLQGDRTWLVALNELLDQGASQVVFTFLPQHVSADFYELAEISNKVVFGLPVFESGNELIIPPLPKVAQGLKLNVGLIKAAENEGGVYRYQSRFVEDGGAQFPVLEFLAAKQLGVEEGVADDGPYLVHFSGGFRRLPKISIERILDKGLVSELVSNRTILIGVKAKNVNRSYFTPISSEVGLVSELYFQAFSLDTLLSQNVVTTWGLWWVLVVSILITILSLIFYQLVSFQWSLVATFSLTLLYLFISWLALHLFLVRFPLVELVVTQWLSMTLIWGYRMVQEKKARDDMLLDLSVKLQDKVFPISFYNADDPWEELVTMINQTLNLNRLIFLERVKGDHRLKEVKAFNCSIEDIAEARRDYERTPYSTAISEGQPILLSKPYLKEADVEERVYLAPLMFAGDILGFWAFTVEPNKVGSSERFVELARAYMGQVSEALHYRQEWEKRIATEGNKLLKYLRVQGSGSTFQVLSKSVTLLDRRMSELQEVFNRLSDAHVLYDLFGRVLLINAKMESFIKLGKLKPYSMTVLDFIVELALVDVVKARSILQTLIFEQEEVSLPVDDFGDGDGRNYVLHLKPMTVQENQASGIGSIDVDLFQLRGILCEIVDVTELKKSAEQKESMLEHFSYQIRSDLAALSLGVSILESESLPDEDKRSTLSGISSKLDAIDTTVRRLDEQVDPPFYDDLIASSLLPVDGSFALKCALQNVEENRLKKLINIHFKVRDFMSLAFSEHKSLEKLLTSILEIMIEDAYQQSDLWVELREESDFILFNFHNNGIGIIDEVFNEGDSEHLPVVDGTLNLFTSRRLAEKWGGELLTDSEVGSGTVVNLKLKRFM